MTGNIVRTFRSYITGSPYLKKICRHRYAPHVGLIICSWTYYLVFPVLFNYVDGVVFGTASIDSLFPHYPILYPLSTKALMFFTGSFCAATLWMKAIHFLLLIPCLLYTLEAFPSHRQRWYFACFIMAYSPIFVFQLGPGTEAFFISFTILFLGSFLHLYHGHKGGHFFVHLFAFTCLLLSRHTGAVLGILPVAYFGFKSLQDKKISELRMAIKFGVALCLVILLIGQLNRLTSFVLSSPDVPLYGRPATHIIKNVFNGIPTALEKDALSAAWQLKASNELERKAQWCIINNDNPWHGPQECLLAFVQENFPFATKQAQKNLTESTINKVYWQFLSTGHQYVWKERLISLWKFMPLVSDASHGMRSNHYYLFENEIHDSYNFWNCNFNSYFSLQQWRLHLLTIPIIIEVLFSTLLLLWLVYSVAKNYNAFVRSTILQALLIATCLQLIAMWMFTEYISRYNIPTFILLIVIAVCWIGLKDRIDQSKG
jgi:hypothetical protein